MRRRSRRQSHARTSRRYSVYLLFYYKSSNPDTCVAQMYPLAWRSHRTQRVVAERDEARARIDELELHISALTVALEHTNNGEREREIERKRERKRERERERECLQRLQRLQRDHTSSDGEVRTLRQAGEDNLSEVSEENADDSEDERKSAFLGAVRSAGEI
jgi:hypothetical protein